MIVTSALRELDGFDTIDLFEQALHVQVCMCVRAFAQHNVFDTSTAQTHVGRVCVSHHANHSELVA